MELHADTEIVIVTLYTFTERYGDMADNGILISESCTCLFLRTVAYVVLQENECNLSWNWSVLGEEDNLNHFNELPYQTLTSYDIENNFISGKRKLANLMNNDDFQTII